MEFQREVFFHHPTHQPKKKKPLILLQNNLIILTKGQKSEPHTALAHLTLCGIFINLNWHIRIPKYCTGFFLRRTTSPSWANCYVSSLGDLIKMFLFTFYCQAQPKPQLEQSLGWVSFSFNYILTAFGPFCTVHIIVKPKPLVSWAELAFFFINATRF